MVGAKVGRQRAWRGQDQRSAPQACRCAASDHLKQNSQGLGEAAEDPASKDRRLAKGNPEARRGDQLLAGAHSLVARPLA